MSDIFKDMQANVGCDYISSFLYFFNNIIQINSQ